MTPLEKMATDLGIVQNPTWSDVFSKFLGGLLTAAIAAWLMQHTPWFHDWSFWQCAALPMAWRFGK